MTAALKLDNGRQAYEAAQAAVEQEAQQAAAERQARLDAYDRALVESYDDAALGRQIAEVREELRAAVAADPALSALARLYAAQLHRAHMRVEVASAANRVSIARTFPDRPADPPTPELLIRVIAEVGEEINADEMDRREVAREPQPTGSRADPMTEAAPASTSPAPVRGSSRADRIEGEESIHSGSTIHLRRRRLISSATPPPSLRASRSQDPPIRIFCPR